MLRNLLTFAVEVVFLTAAIILLVDAVLMMVGCHPL